jgi:hypothetical protein
MIIVVALELAQHGCGVPLVDDQKAVDEFPADSADKAFRDRIRSRRAHRRLDDPDVDGGEDRVEGSGELGIAVADQEPEALVGVVKVHQWVAGLLGEPRCGRVGGHAEDVDSASGAFDDEERVEPVQADGVEVKQVACQDRLGLRAEELSRSDRPVAARD